MQETFHDHYTSITIGGKPICNLQLADNIDLVGNKDSELQDLTSRLADKATASGTEVSIGKSKIMNNSMNKNNSMNFKTSPADS